MSSPQPIGAPISWRNFKAMSQTSATFLKIWTGSSSFRWEAQIGHPSPEEIFVNPQFPMGSRRFWREARDADQKWIVRNQISGTVTGNPSMLIGFPKNLSGMLDCRLAIEKTNHDWPFSDQFPGNIIGNDRLLMSSPDIE